MPPNTVGPHELDSVVELIADQQRRPERNINYVGTEPAGIRAELDALHPPWTETVRVVRTGDGTIVGVSLLEWDESLGRAWIFGPWVAGDEDAWSTHARDLVDAALTQRPPDVLDVELSGDLANVRLEALAVEVGLPPRQSAAYALDISADQAGNWPPSAAVRPAGPGDVEHIRPIHEIEFPNTYATPQNLLDDYTTIVVERDGEFMGYAAGQIHPDGEGVIDYIAVHPDARGEGFGRILTTSLTRMLLDTSPERRVSLVVTEERRAARGLYESIGYRQAAAFTAYRGPLPVRR